MLLLIGGITWLLVVYIAFFRYHPPGFISTPLVTKSILHLSILALLYLAAYYLGRLCLSWIPGIGAGLQGAMIRLATGLGLIALLYLILGFAGLLYHWSLLGVLVVIVISGFALFLRLSRPNQDSSKHNRLKDDHGYDATFSWEKADRQNKYSIAKDLHEHPIPVLVLIIALFLVLSIIWLNTLLPPTSSDALIYHIELPRQFYRAHSIIELAGNIFSWYPLNMQMLNLLGFAIDSPQLARSLHFGFYIGIILLLYAICKEHLGIKGYGFSLVFFAFNPLVIFVAKMAYNDLALTFYTLTVIVILCRFIQDWDLKYLYLMGFLCGIAFGVKYTGLLVTSGVIIILIFEGFITSRSLRTITVSVIIIVTMTLLAALPYLIRNQVGTGNPVYPFFSSIFKGSGLTEEEADQLGKYYSNYGQGRDALSLLSLPWDISVRSDFTIEGFDGITGPFFLMFIPFSLLYKESRRFLGIIALFSIFYFIAWIVFLQLRYLLPIFPLLSILSSCGVLALQEKSNKYIGAWSISTKIIVYVMVIFLVAAVILPHIIDLQTRLPYLSGYQTDEEYLYANLGGYYRICDFIKERLPQNTRILVLFEKRVLYLDRAYDAVYDVASILWFMSPERSYDQILDELNDEGFTHILINLEAMSMQPSKIPSGQRYSFRQRFERLRVFKDGYLVLIASESPFELYKILY